MLLFCYTVALTAVKEAETLAQYYDNKLCKKTLLYEIQSEIQAKNFLANSILCFIARADSDSS
jgi:hypothetical protein